ncbi:Uncharacterised protein [Actinobacillus seminis]|uniref:Uncharacterized protein n=1 Tax=Actinobacillus seminis TaxID=722 RepID=A0A380VGG0_9PAST|nr:MULTISPECIES: hypothetical protein [Pasteurellaceae]SUU36956.1 Uncharacterised protein [Actinobacillus seminis]
MNPIGLSVGLAILAIIGCLAAYGASKLEESTRKQHDDLKAKKLGSSH